MFGRALWEWSRGGGRGEQGRGRGGARTPSSAGLLEVAARPPAGGHRWLYPEPGNARLRGRGGKRGAEPGRRQELRGAASSFADSASLGPFRKWVGVVWPASGGIRTPASRKKEFTCVSRQRAGLEGSGGQLSLLAQWAVR